MTDANELLLEAKVENLSAVQDFISERLKGADCPSPMIQKILIAAEEIFVNLAYYAYAPDVGDALIRVIVSNGAVIEFEDKGVRYNPLTKEDPDISAPASERDIGGLGVLMVKKLMDDVQYRYEDGKNVLSITKRFG